MPFCRCWPFNKHRRSGEMECWRHGIIQSKSNNPILQYSDTPWPRPLAQTWFIDSIGWLEHIDHYRPSKSIIVCRTRAGWCARPEFYSSCFPNITATGVHYSQVAPGRANTPLRELPLWNSLCRKTKNGSAMQSTALLLQLVSCIIVFPQMPWGIMCR